GIPAMKVEGKRRAGAVLVIDGSSRRVITEASAGLPGDSYADSFGTAVASGDFNDDRVADLAVGSDEWDDAAGVSRGGVTVFYGGTRGLTIAGAVQFQGAP